MFKVGDIVSYPMHGVGVVESIEKREVRGVEGLYYVLCFRTDGLKVLLPLDRAKEAGLRHIISAEEAEEVLAFIASCEADEPCANWNRRYRFNLDRLKANDAKSIARVVKCLSARSTDKGLSSGEKAMLHSARTFLVDELSAATGRPAQEISALVDTALKVKGA